MATAIEGSEGRRLEGAIRRTRAELDDTLGELRSAMGASFDWRALVRRWPWASLLVAAIVGARIGGARERGRVRARERGF
jgi:hypothetical protein